MWKYDFTICYYPLVKFVVAVVIKIMQRWNNQTRIFKINCENVTLPYPKKSLFTIILYNNWSIKCIYSLHLVICESDLAWKMQLTKRSFIKTFVTISYYAWWSSTIDICVCFMIPILVIILLFCLFNCIFEEVSYL